MKSEDRTLELGLTKQRSTDLHFYLYRRALHPELFHIFMDKHLVYGDFQADVWVSGLSHLVTVQSKDTLVAELAIGPSELLTDRNLVTQFRFRGERDFQRFFEQRMIRCIQSEDEWIRYGGYYNNEDDQSPHGAGAMF